MQGFQLLVDDLSGFGSVAGQTLSQLQDDFPKSSVLAFPIRSHPQSQVVIYLTYPFLPPPWAPK